jgi:hypothetical protein
VWGWGGGFFGFCECVFFPISKRATKLSFKRTSLPASVLLRTATTSSWHSTSDMFFGRLHGKEDFSGGVKN